MPRALFRVPGTCEFQRVIKHVIKEDSSSAQQVSSDSRLAVETWP